LFGIINPRSELIADGQYIALPTVCDKPLDKDHAMGAKKLLIAWKSIKGII